MNNPTLLDPQDLVFMVAGMLYSSGHHPIQLDERSLQSAVNAATDLLIALGLVPFNARRIRGTE